MVAKSDMFSFLQVAKAAFPRGFDAQIEEAVEQLGPYVEETYDYRRPMRLVFVGSEELKIPYRFHLSDSHAAQDIMERSNSSILHCLGTRSTDGYVRQRCLLQILKVNKPWSIPFVVLLSGEYVIELMDDMVTSLQYLGT